MRPDPPARRPRCDAHLARLRSVPGIGLIGASKPPKVAQTACMRKLLALCNTLCQHQAMWDPTMA